MTTSHTPGPDICRTCKMPKLIEPHDGFAIARCILHEEAPAMLEALKRVAAFADYPFEQFPLSEHIADARAIIDRIEGTA